MFTVSYVFIPVSDFSYPKTCKFLIGLGKKWFGVPETILIKSQLCLAHWLSPVLAFSTQSWIPYFQGSHNLSVGLNQELLNPLHVVSSRSSVRPVQLSWPMHQRASDADSQGERKGVPQSYWLLLLPCPPLHPASFSLVLPLPPITSLPGILYPHMKPKFNSLRVRAIQWMDLNLSDKEE